MAGVLLYLNKERNKPGEFSNKTQVMESYIRDTFGPLFAHIDFNRPDKNTFLVQFRKDEKKKYFRDNKGNWLAYEGSVFALDKTRIYNAADLWQLYLKKGDDLGNYLDGPFVVKIFDAEKQRVIVCTDFINNKINYWAETENALMFTPFLILASFVKKPQLDLQAFNEYMWRYYIMSGRSMLKGVSRMDAGTLYAVSAGKVTRNKYWEFPHTYTKLSFDKSLAELSASLKESARLIHADGRTPVIDFTAGQDSRTILAAFTNQKLPFINTIYGKEDYPEVVAVKEMAQRHNLNLKHIRLEDDFVQKPWQNARDDILLSSCEEPVYLIGRILHMRRQYLKYSSLTVNGVHGRFYKDGTWNEMYLMNFYREPKKFNSDLFIKYRALNKNYRDDIFNKKMLDVKNASHDYYRNMIAGAIEGYENSPVAIQVDKLDMEHYAMYGMMGNSICNNVLDLLSPLLFRRNLEKALVMPAKWRYNLSKVQRHLVYGMDPELAREKTGVAGIDMIPRKGLGHLLFLMRYWFMITQKFRDKIKNLLGMNVSTALQKAWNYLEVYNNFFDDPQVQALLTADQMALNNILDKKVWRELLDQYQNPQYRTVARMEYILKIVTVEYFLSQCKSIDVKGTEKDKA